jgi:hypothetical protein
MVAAPAGLAEMVLPQMDHFMSKASEYVFLWPVPEVRRV